MITFLDLSAAFREFRTASDAVIHRILGPVLYILGQKVRPFEAKSAGYCGANHVAGLANLLDAMMSLITHLCELSCMKKTAWAAPND